METVQKERDRQHRTGETDTLVKDGEERI